MANFNRFDDRRASYNFEKRGRSFFRADSPLSSPLFRKKQFSFHGADASMSVPSSVASSRDSSLDRGGPHQPHHESGMKSIHQVLERVRSSPKLSLRQRFQVMRTSSFSDADAIRNNLESRRKKCCSTEPDVSGATSRRRCRRRRKQSVVRYEIGRLTESS